MPSSRRTSSSKRSALRTELRAWRLNPFAHSWSQPTARSTTCEVYGTRATPGPRSEAASSHTCPRSGIGTSGAQHGGPAPQVLEDEPGVGAGEVPALDDRAAVAPAVGPGLLADRHPRPPSGGEREDQAAAVGEDESRLASV